MAEPAELGDGGNFACEHGFASAFFQQITQRGVGDRVRERWHCGAHVREPGLVHPPSPAAAGGDGGQGQPQQDDAPAPAGWGG